MMRRTVAAVVAVLGLVALTVTLTAQPPSAQRANAGCPPGYHLGGERGRPVGTDQGSATLGAGLNRVSSSTAAARVCTRLVHPESVYDVAALNSQRADAAAAPYSTVPTGAYRQATEQRAAMLAAPSQVPGASGHWTPLGKTPLIADGAPYTSVNGEGLADLSGRIDSFDYDPAHHRLFATIGTGGVWMSTDLAQHWSSIGDALPTQVVGAVGWVPAGGIDASVGGTVVAVGGEPINGGDTRTGLGAFWTNNLGDTWHHATGVPDGIMGYQVAPDPAHPGTVYVATSMGLYRSTNAGRTYTNVNLPTKAGTTNCAGATGYGRCEFANWVTDVVVQAPGGTTDAAGGEVLAAVGYRAGTTKTFTNGQIEATSNGLYRSASGAPGSFAKLAPSGFAPTSRIGRTELGQATGAQQDHNYLYAIVQDACLFNGGVPVLDVPDQLQAGACNLGLPDNSVLNGVYQSADFGQTWTELGNNLTVAQNPTTQSALAGGEQLLLYAPGVQAWYNEWIKPDPTRQDSNGAPTRLTFGLEEVWATNPNPVTKTTTPFVVIGPYFSGSSCLILANGFPSCPTSNTKAGETTTHPDQHDALYIPDKSGGGVTLLVGNDGGAYTQHTAAGQDFTNHDWGRGHQGGFHTLMSYDAETARDGTIWFGLQDNGEGLLTPSGTQYEAYGGDAFFTAVDPNNSKHAYEEYTLGDISVTADGGENWTDISPACATVPSPAEPNCISNPQFNNPFVMDPTDANHLITGGPEIVETTKGVDTRNFQGTGAPQSDWKKVYSVGSANQMSSIDLQGDAAYVGFCGVCDIINNWDVGFHRGLATNVGGSAPPKRLTSQGWHNASMHGLPNRMITGIAIDPQDTKTVYVTLGGYNYRDWVPPGSYLDGNKDLGSGHVFVSHDAGEHFTNVSGNLPNAVATWVEIHGGQLLVGSDVGAFISSNRNGSAWAPLGGSGLPAVPISTIRAVPGADNLLTVATFGRGIYCYQFPGPGKATCANRGANFRQPLASNNKPLATTGLQVGVPVTGGILIAIALLLATRRRRT